MKIFYVVSSILNIISSLYGLILFILNARKSKTNQIFAAFTLCVFVWSIFYYLFTNTTNPSLALLYMQIGVGFAIFIAPTFFHFTTHLLNRADEYNTQSTLFYVYGIILYLTAYSPLFIPSVQEVPPLTYFPLAGPTYIFLILGYFLISGYGLFILYKERQNPQLSTKKRKELNWVFWGIFIAYLGGATEYPVNYHIPIYPVGNCFVSLYMLFITYTILKYQSFDIQFILKKSLIYTFLIATITTVYLALTLILENQFKETLGYQSFLLSLTVALVISLLFIPLKNLLERVIFRNSFAKILEENDYLRQEVIQTEKLKSVATLASGMAHEIKNPLTALKTFSEYFPQKLHDIEFLKKFAPIVSAEINRIDSLVRELLDYARPLPPVLKPVHLHTLLDQTMELVSINLTKTNILVKKFYSNDNPEWINADSNQLKQALLNIFLNAIDAMAAGGTLTLTTGTQNKKVVIEIKDTGTGIAAADLPYIFDPFFSRKAAGTGLGLSISREIIRNHGGRILATSKRGEGTTFIIELPTIHPSDKAPGGP